MSSVMRCVCVCVCSPRIHTPHQVIINVITALTNVVAFSRGEQKLLILIRFLKKIPI